MCTSDPTSPSLSPILGHWTDPRHFTGLDFRKSKSFWTMKPLFELVDPREGIRREGAPRRHPAEGIQQPSLKLGIIWLSGGRRTRSVQIQFRAAGRKYAYCTFVIGL